LALVSQYMRSLYNLTLINYFWVANATQSVSFALQIVAFGNKRFFLKPSNLVMAGCNCELLQ
jgi:hypothetical protein